VLITFSGLDGAGKSTLIARLERDLAEARHGSVVLHMNDHVGVHAYLRMLRNWVGAKSPNPAPSEWQAARARAAREAAAPVGWRRRLKGRLVRLRNAVVWSKGLRRALYPLDLVVFLAYRLYVERVRRRVLIMDRYFYDTLVDVGDGGRGAWLGLLERLTPTPDVAVYLDVDPETAFARKGEYTVEYLRRRHERYRAVLPRVRSCVALPVGELAATHAALRAAVMARLVAR
jgi:thymidylate kinase